MTSHLWPWEMRDSIKKAKQLDEAALRRATAAESALDEGGRAWACTWMANGLSQEADLEWGRAVVLLLWLVLSPTADELAAERARRRGAT